MGACLLSNFLLFRTMALWCKFFMRILIWFSNIFRLVIFSMECSCMEEMAPITLAMMVMRGLVFHPLSYSIN